MESQAEMILSHLKNNGTLTPLQALIKFQCLRLGARIYDLRCAGHKIKTEYVVLKGKHKNKIIGCYRLVS